MLLHATVVIRNCPVYCEGVGSYKLKFKPVIVAEYVAPVAAIFFVANGNACDSTGASKAKTGSLVPQNPETPIAIFRYRVADVYTVTFVCAVQVVVVVATPPTIAVSVTSTMLKFIPTMVTDSARPFNAALAGSPALATAGSYEKLKLRVPITVDAVRLLTALEALPAYSWQPTAVCEIHDALAQPEAAILSICEKSANPKFSPNAVTAPVMGVLAEYPVREGASNVNWTWLVPTTALTVAASVARELPWDTQENAHLTELPLIHEVEKHALTPSLTPEQNKRTDKAK